MPPGGPKLRSRVAAPGVGGTGNSRQCRYPLAHGAEERKRLFDAAPGVLRAQRQHEEVVGAQAKVSRAKRVHGPHEQHGTDDDDDGEGDLPGKEQSRFAGVNRGTSGVTLSPPRAVGSPHAAFRLKPEATTAAEGRAPHCR